MEPYKRHSDGRRLHAVLAEKALGKPLPKGAVVHHVDGDGWHNEGNNLIICPSQKYHALLHRREEALRLTGDANLRRCQFCAQWVDPSSPAVGASNPKRGDGGIWHRACVNTYNAARRAQIRADGGKWW